ncbi:MAG: LON peptidase substrate-binding domain-containing protein [Rhizobiales bacterium]|nr:LON peptidase substrate-binding domain-containing protein [Rhizobacter sp.]
MHIPLFPLQSVLFPDGVLPLQIFEVRYLDMIARQHAAQAPFGVVCMTEGRETRQRAAGPGGDGFAHEAFHPIGTLARIDDLQRPHPGLMKVRCIGTQRFRICGSAEQKFGLWGAEVELLADDPPVVVPDDIEFTRAGLQALMRQIEASIAAAGEAGAELPLQPPYRWDDCGWLANRWCELLPLDAAVKQRFMVLDSPVLRLELVADALGQMGFAMPQA